MTVGSECTRHIQLLQLSRHLDLSILGGESWHGICKILYIRYKHMHPKSGQYKT